MRWLRTAAPLVLVALAGCGDEDERVRLVPVSGTITLNGKPMADATVTFLPDKANKDSTPGADTTGPDGNYKLRFKSRSGVAPGKYKVSVTPSPAAATGPVPDALKDDPVMARLAAEPRAAPERKAAGTKTEFDAEVSPAGDVLDFDVKTKAVAK